MPPAIWDGQHNAAPEREALLAIVSAAEHAEKLTEKLADQAGNAPEEQSLAHAQEQP